MAVSTISSGRDSTRTVRENTWRPGGSGRLERAFDLDRRIERSLKRDGAWCESIGARELTFHAPTERTFAVNAAALEFTLPHPPVTTHRYCTTSVLPTLVTHNVALVQPA